ncbi:Conserved membrane protein of uncharacterised function [Mycobacterium tuberculosis]|uniref:hypothetical protein n=1 Tax=Mycobacterium tuberculosis TaxID=1773 RepID=UPI0005E9E10F|nr:hypothetical protein [Mycobacterium tuberculosis]CMA02789.1 Conserved membrane protein of uncharacterised function [Mycobacterium tuberculosis]
MSQCFAVKGIGGADQATLGSAEILVKYAQLADKRARVYVLVSTWLVVWGIWHVYFVEAVFPNAILWLHYYAASYEFGFVRRGLGGELIRMLTGDHFFAGAYTVLWTSITVWLIALAVVVWLILSTGNRSERRIMLALLVPVLPFAFSYAIYNPHPELFGMTALVAFSIFLTRAHTSRTRVILSTLYGLTMAVLALIHEAIPLEFALGAVLAIIVLSKNATGATRRICTALAIGPGTVSVLLLAVVGRRDIADQLCAHIPHGMVENPWAVATTPQRVLVGFRALFGAFLLGLLFFVATTSMIRYVSAVPVRTFFAELRGNLALPVLASALLVPLFITAVDWTRWWVMITLDVAIVYILYAIDRPEIEQPPSRRNVQVFVCVVLVLAVIPTGSANNIGR